MKKITLLIVVLLAFNLGYGQTTLSEGDIAITGVIADNPDEFSFVLLTDVLSGTIINFTDGGWTATGGFRGYNAANGRISEGVVNWTATSFLPCGTEIIITDTGSNTHSATSGTAFEVADTGFNLASAGDQLIAYQGTAGSPVFLFAVHFANATGWITSTTSQTSAIPAGLTDGVNAIDLGNSDNNNYLCTVTSNQTLILQAVATVNATNWYQTNSNTVANRPVLGGCTYTCSAAGTCAGLTTTWDGTIWNNGTPNLTMPAVINADYNSLTNGNVRACSLTINATFRLTVDNGSFVEVENDVDVDGELFVETQGNFVQNDNSGIFTINGVGVARVNKQTASKAAWYYYTYWSSPVVGETLWSVFPDVDYGRRFWFDAANFVDTDGDNVNDNTLPDWKISDGTMDPGVGYAVTEAQLFPGGAGIANFEGQFNTGDITTNLAFNAANTGTYWNLIGNPYPSAIDFIAFQSANSSMVDGAAYFWSQASPPDAGNPGNEVLNFNRNDYATFTIGTGGAAGTSGFTPDQFIPSGQSFFIAGLGNGNVTFTNAMRMADGTSNNQFFKNTKSKKASSNIANKLWINLTSDNGVFNQILVGYVDGATDLNDGMSYDAQRLLKADFSATLYSSIENSNEKFAVQGKAPESLAEDEIISLGYSTNIDVATLYKFSIAQLQGNFLTENSIYLKDNLLNTVHNLSDSDYTFTSEVGEFNDRFEIHFNSAALSTADINANSNTLKIVELEGDAVRFTASKAITTIRIFDLLGRQLYQFEGNNTSETYKLSNLSSSI